MSFKSYAQAGQFSSYYIDLPIKTEINEDLRAASDFVKQMEVSQKYREKWANSYLDALDKKSSIERQNRDDNYEFMQNNFRRIYEGEQREFDGRMSELQREQAERANAAPGFFDDLLPALIKLAPQLISMYGQYQESQLQAKKDLSEKLLTGTGVGARQLNAHQNLFEAAITNDEKTEIARGFAENHLNGATWQEARQLFEMSGKARVHSGMIAFENDIGRIGQDLRSAALPYGGGPLDPTQQKYQGAQGRNIWNEDFESYRHDVINESLGNGQRSETSDLIKYGHQNKAIASIVNGIRSNANNTWEGQAKQVFKQADVNQINNGVFLGGGPGVLAAYNQHITRALSNPSINPEDARLVGTQKFVEVAKSANWNYDQFQQFRRAFDSQRGGTRRGGPIDGAFDELGRFLMQRDVDIQKVHTNFSLSESKKNLAAMKQEGQGIYDREGPVAYSDWVQQLRSKDWQDPDTQKYVNGLTTGHPAVTQSTTNPSWEQKHGISLKRVNDAATNMILDGLGSHAANKKLGRKGLLELGGSKIALSKLEHHMKLNMPLYERKYAGVYSPGSEELLQQAAHDSFKELREAGSLAIDNEGAKDNAAGLVTYKEPDFNNANVSVNNNTAEYIQLTKENPDKFNVLVPSDLNQIQQYGRLKEMVGPTSTPDSYDARVSLHNNASVRARAQALGITNDESLDQMLDMAGYPNAITNPFTKKDFENNNKLLQRYATADSKITTNYQLQILDSAKNKTLQPASYIRREGTLQQQDHFEHGTQGIKNAQGVFANQEVADSAASIAEAYPNMTWTSTQRTPEYQEQMKKDGYFPSDTSNHLKGISFDAVGPDAQKLRQDIDSGKVQGLDYYIGPDYSHIHFDIIGPVSIAGQQPEPSVVPVSPDSVLAQQFQDYQEGRGERPEGLPEREVTKEAPNQWWDFLDLFPNEKQPQTPEHLKEFDPAGVTKNGVAFGKLNGERVRVQPYTYEVYPISERTWNILVDETDGPVRPMSFLGGGN